MDQEVFSPENTGAAASDEPPKTTALEPPIESTTPQDDPWLRIFAPVSEPIQPFNMDTRTGGIVDVLAIEALDPPVLVNPHQVRKFGRFVGVVFEPARQGWKVRTVIKRGHRAYILTSRACANAVSGGKNSWCGHSCRILRT
jgi:hypothetical protein